jgi:uncharacterized protein (DUF885 family)
MLGNEMHRVVRFFIDNVLYNKGWTREETIQFSMANEATSEAGITTEIKRYIAIPGQALSYKIGQLKIIELRQKVQDKMGPNFDIIKFHEKGLKSGVMPLALLKKRLTLGSKKNKITLNFRSKKSFRCGESFFCAFTTSNIINYPSIFTIVY